MAKSVDIGTKENLRTLYRSDKQLAQPAELYQTRTVSRGAQSGVRRLPDSEGGRVGRYVVFETEGYGPAPEQLQRMPAEEEMTSVYHTSGDEVPFIPTGTISLNFAPEATPEQRDALLARYGLSPAGRSSGPAVFVTVRPGEDAVQIASTLQQEPLLALVEPVLETPIDYRAFTLPTARQLQRQWHLRNDGPDAHGPLQGLLKGADARVVTAWAKCQSLGSPQVVIGVIDDGFDLRHPDLATRVLHPWPMTADGITADIAPPSTAHSHGTRCAGIAIGAAGDVIGCAPACSWMPVRQSGFNDVLICDWFDHMLEKGAWVINCSWGAKAAKYELSALVRDKITECAEKGRGGKGCVIVFAAGNNNRNVNAPDQGFIDGFVIHEKVIAVAASTSIDSRASSSSFGKEIWVCAPSGDSGGPVGSPIVSDITTTDLNRRYFEHFIGTSGACALVSGICGLILSANPDLTAEEVKQILRTTARPIDRAHGEYDGRHHSIRYGFGCVDAEAAIEEALRMLALVASGVS